MSYVIQDTIWPGSVNLDGGVKDLLALFYELADNTGPGAGPRMASDVFTKDAKVVAGTGESNGSEAISRSRDNAWKLITKRHHVIQQVFVNDKEGSDLMVLGRVEMEFRNGKSLEQDFTARVVVNLESKAAGTPRFELMQVFAKRSEDGSSFKGHSPSCLGVVNMNSSGGEVNVLLTELAMNQAKNNIPSQVAL
ncbi:hypothetical protein LTR92_000211 [Exophiala xenobiotica]|nr:hypothetical protein LTR92_000211 [Exophiala xenobiotica]